MTSVSSDVIDIIDHQTSGAVLRYRAARSRRTVMEAEPVAEVIVISDDEGAAYNQTNNDNDDDVIEISNSNHSHIYDRTNTPSPGSSTRGPSAVDLTENVTPPSSRPRAIQTTLTAGGWVTRINTTQHSSENGVPPAPRLRTMQTTRATSAMASGSIDSLSEIQPVTRARARTIQTSRTSTARYDPVTGSFIQANRSLPVDRPVRSHARSSHSTRLSQRWTPSSYTAARAHSRTDQTESNSGTMPMGPPIGRRRMVAQRRSVAWPNGATGRGGGTSNYDMSVREQLTIERTRIIASSRFQPGNLSYEQMSELDDDEEVRQRKRAPQHVIDRLVTSIADGKGGQCCICQCEMEVDEPVCALKCGHQFHDACIRKWLTYGSLCPVDKSVVS